MANRRFEMFEYRQIIHRMRMGQTDRAIARAGLMGRVKCGALRAVAVENGWLSAEALPDDNELFRALNSGKAPNPTREPLCLVHRQRIGQWVEEGLQATTIHRALCEQFGFAGSYSSLLRMVNKLRSRSPKATCILDFAPGETAQVDFGKGPVITDVFTGERISTWIFVMTLSYSRHMYAEIVENQKIGTWLSCHRRAFEFFAGVPTKLIIDNLKSAITRACFHDPQVQRSYGELAEGYGFLVSPCPPADPKKKGRVESGVKYVKRSFVPLRQFRSLVDANEQLTRWVLETAGNRIHGTTREKPLVLFADTEKPLLAALPKVPVTLAVWVEHKLHADCHVRHEYCLYSAPYRLVGQKLWLKVTDTTVQIFFNLELVATHRRLRKPGSRSTIDEHLPPEAIAYKMQTPQWCLRQAEEVGPRCHRLIEKLFGHRVLDNLRAAQGVIGFRKKYGDARLEAACNRALFFDNPKRKAVKSILEKGLDQLPLDEPAKVIALPTTYTRTGRFMRKSSELQLSPEGGRP